jgi:hypothetical protein
MYLRAQRLQQQLPPLPPAHGQGPFVALVLAEQEVGNAKLVHRTARRPDDVDDGLFRKRSLSIVAEAEQTDRLLALGPGRERSFNRVPRDCRAEYGDVLCSSRGHVCRLRVLIEQAGLCHGMVQEASGKVFVLARLLCQNAVECGATLVVLRVWVRAIVEEKVEAFHQTFLDGE